MKEIDAIYDEKSAIKPIEPGIYPAHIKGLATREVNTKAGPAIIVNMTYKVADEVADLSQTVYEMDGYKHKKNNEGNSIPVLDADNNEVETDCSHLIGRDLWDNGTFVFTNSESGSKNERYFKLLMSLGVKVEEQTLGDKKVKKLVLIEEEDVMGKAVLVDLQRTSYITPDTRNLAPEQQVRKESMKVMSLSTWPDGQDISKDELEEDVPF